MASTAQLTANRANAQHSTGPLTPAGKAASSKNATRHGLSSAHFALLPNEDRTEFEALVDSLHTEFEPEGGHETFLVQQMAHARWRLIRIDRLESEAFDEILTAPNAANDSSDGRILQTLATPGNALDKLERYRAAAERSYYKAVRELETSRARQKKAEAAALDTYIKKVVYAPIPGDTHEKRSAEAFLNAQNEPNPAARIRKEDLGNLALRL